MFFAAYPAALEQEVQEAISPEDRDEQATQEPLTSKSVPNAEQETHPRLLHLKPKPQTHPVRAVLINPLEPVILQQAMHTPFTRT